VRHYAFGDTVCKAGEPAEGLYVVKSGSVRVFSDEHGKEVSIGVRKAGEVIGDIAMLREVHHELSARASLKTELWFIPRAAIEPVLVRNPVARDFVTSYVAISSAGGLVARLFDLRGKVGKEELEEFVRSVGVKRVAAGKEILTQEGRDDRRLYVLRQGQVKLVYHDGADEYTLATLQAGETFGEKACLMRQEQMASAVAVTPATLLVIPEKTAHAILERNAGLREVLEDRIRFIERELERQKKLAERRKRPLRLDLESTPEFGEKVIRRFALVEQAEEMDCGAACLAMLCRHYGLQVTLGKLRELANVTTQGATLDSLARAGEPSAFRAAACNAPSTRCRVSSCPSSCTGRATTTRSSTASRRARCGWPTRRWASANVRRGIRARLERHLPGLHARPGHGATAVERSPWLRFVAYLRPYRTILLHLFLATFVIQMLGIVPPLIIQNILDGVVVHQNVSLLHLLIAGLIIANVFSQLMATVRAYLANYMVRNLDFSMMAGFFKHTMSLPFSFFAKRKTGDIIARFQENQTIRAFLTESTVTTMLNLLMVFIYFSILFVYNVKLTLILIAFVIPIMALTILVTPAHQAVRARVFNASTDAHVLPDGGAGRRRDHQGHGQRAPGAPEVGKEIRQGARHPVPCAAIQHPGRPRQPAAECRHHDRHPVGRRQPGARARTDDRPADRLQRPDGQRPRAADGAGGPVEPAGRCRRGDGAAGRRARHRTGTEASDAASRVVLPDLQGDLNSRTCISATAATTRLMCWTTSASTSGAAS
jgi:subfamily B ATP-binding cassette protein HlyB/CyaB